ncbi:TolC family protein [Massilibacteroides sp.]|uniref:TolC family protein n=1 Tax=Massilibacteroides sp. TaxID=2034766 RepID=UPI0026255F64|nr:TolC family protein [Massilibacteroides sp.]MDD4514579.1 TolC family protein [Massilibacteroides sp.]
MKYLFLLFLSLLVVPANAQRILTLEECRQLTVKNNKELQIAGERVKISSSDKKAAFTKFFPQLSATGTFLWNEKDINLVDYNALGDLSALIPSQVKEATRLDIENVWIGGVSLVQPVFMGGKIVSYNQITKYAQELAESMNNLKLQQVIYKTDEVYWQVVSLANKKDLADSYVVLLNKMDSDVSEMIKEGVATYADGLSVKVRLNEAEMAQTKVANGLALSRMLLAQLCGLPMNESYILADEMLADLPMSDDLPVGNVEEAFLNRMELKSLNLAERIYKKKEALVLADMLPNIALTANYLVMNPNSFNGFKNEFGGMFNVGVAMKIPLSGWWEGVHKRNSARAETTIKRLELEDAREKIELEVTQSAYKLNEANKKLSASMKNKERAEENLRHANLGFNEGVIPVLNLMEAQTAWMSAGSDLIDAQIEVKLTKVYLMKSMGKLDIEK